MPRPFVRYAGVLLLGILLEGCTFFAGKPALPKQASIEHAQKPTIAADFDAMVEEADIVYFPVERAGFGAKAEPAALLIEALQKRRKPFAIGWDLIDAREQGQLDSLASQDANAREQSIAALELAGSGRAREHCRTILRELRDTNVSQVALRYPGNTGARREFAAEQIARYLRTTGREARLLAFLHEEDLEGEEGVPEYVAQKIEARQLVFGSDSKKERSRLLTTILQRRPLQVVNGAPASGGD
jgi:hypothetical protein